MKTITISSKGQVALSKEILEALHLGAGSKLEPSIDGDRLVLTPVITIPRSQAWAWTPDWKEKVDASKDNVRQGKVTTFKTVAAMRKAFKRA